MLGGRQFAYMIFQHYTVTETQGALNDFSDLLRVKLHSGNLSVFQSDWDSMLIGMQTQPDEVMLESIYREQIEKDTNPKFQNVLTMYDQDILYNGKKEVVRKAGQHCASGSRKETKASNEDRFGEQESEDRKPECRYQNGTT